MRGIAFVIAFMLGAMYLPDPWNAILIFSGLTVFVLGVIIDLVDLARRVNNRFWNALERPLPLEKHPDPTAPDDYLPYVTARYRRK